MVLDIEPLDPAAPNYEQRVRRLAFYERNGFARTGFDLLEGKMRYTVLASEGRFDPDGFSAAVRRVTWGLAPLKLEREASFR